MVTIGQPLLQLESGWERYDNTNLLFKYSGLWAIDTVNTGAYNHRHRWSNDVNATIKFNFYGSGIRIISAKNTNGDSSAKIIIDGTEYSFNQNGALAYQILVFEKNNLIDGFHEVEIKKDANTTSSYLYFDAVDLIVREPYLRGIVKNNNSYHSLSDNTLIHLPDNTTESIIEHGIEQGKNIQLDVPFTKHRYFNDTPLVSVNGKVFTHDVGVINTLSIKELVENKDFEPLYTWYETRMNSNTAPSPLVSSASSVYKNDPRYLEFKAFNGTNLDANDVFIFASGVLTGWIQLDFGKNTQVDSVRITSINLSGSVTATPKDMKLQGSMDGALFEDICTLPQQTGWGANETRSFDLGQKNSYRFYRLVVDSNNGYASYTAIGQLAFGYKREVH